MSYTIRLIEPADIQAIAAIQDSCYDDALYEEDALMSRRLAAQPQSCWVAENRAQEVLAYLLSYPSLDNKVAPLGSDFPVYKAPQLLYLHDMAVSPKARGQALAPALLACAEQYARKIGFNCLALVAVQGSVPYWQKQGFTLVPLDEPTQLQALASYIGQNACYMKKSLP